MKTAAKTVVTFASDSYTMHMTMDLGGKPSTWKGSAKWVRAKCSEGGW
jgi:hypothetical protein